MNTIPKNFQGVLWSVDINKLDLKRDAPYIIHQVLQYGTFEDIRWLFKVYTKKDIVSVFVKHPSKTYPKVVYYFVKNFILDLKKLSLNENSYTTSFHGPIVPRTAGNI